MQTQVAALARQMAQGREDDRRDARLRQQQQMFELDQHRSGCVGPPGSGGHALPLSMGG